MTTDLDVLRENIIQAARKQSNGCDCLCQPCVDVQESVHAYDAALKPDPWQLLDRAANHLIPNHGSIEFQLEIGAALLWRKENPDA